jgi:small GTP-binding protein
MDYDKTCQILLLGDMAVGKTCLINRYTNGVFREEYISTVGIDFYTKQEEINNKTVQVKIWDTVGQERFRALTHNYYRNADGIMLLFDSNNLDSFKHLNLWLNSLQEQSVENFPLIIIGTKSDLPIKVTDNDINNFCNKFNVKWFRTSAKTGENIDFCFNFLAKEIVNIKDNNGKKIKINKQDDLSEHSCC